MQDTIGIDISKDTLDAHRQSDGRHARFGNDRAGLTALRRWIGKAPVRVVYEATGRYHRDMETALDAAGHALVKVNPGRARRFAQAAGYGAKTDRVDASMLARMGMALDLDATPVRSESMHEIKELHVARLGLIKDRTACRNRLDAARNKVVLAQLRARLRQVQGVGLTYASMLEMLDISTPERLSTCDASDLARQLGELNRREILVRRTPGEAEIERWIEGAAFVAGGRRETGTGHREPKSRPHPGE